MIAIILFALLAGINQLVKKNTYIIHASVYLFMAIYVGVGIVSAVGEGSLTERTILYLAFVSVVPLLFALNAVELVAVIVSEEILYLYLIGKYQSAYPVYTTNVGNSFFLSVTGLGLGIYLANRKISGIYNAHMTAWMEEVEQLNRELAATHIDNKEQVKDYLGGNYDFQPAAASIPIIAMTANAFEEDKKMVFDAGVNGHITKPIEISGLIETMRQVLDV